VSGSIDAGRRTLFASVESESEPYYRYGASEFAKWRSRAMYVKPIKEMAIKM